MNKRQLKFLLLIALILIGLILGLTFINSLQSKTAGRDFITRDVQFINKIQVDRSDSSFTLQKNNDGWTVDGMSADSDKVNHIISLINESVIINIASTNSANYSLFNVDDTSGIAVGLYDGDNKILTLVVGKGATHGGYARVDGDPNVYQIDKNLNEFLSGTSEEFRYLPQE